MKLVEIYTAKNEAEAYLIKGLLETSGIQCSIDVIPDQRGIASLQRALLPHVLYVEDSKAEEAKSLISKQ